MILDVSNGFEIKGPPINVKGDTIIIKCGASKYNYLNNITWIYPENSQTQHSE